MQPALECSEAGRAGPGQQALHIPGKDLRAIFRGQEGILHPADYTGRLVWHVDRVREGKPIVIPRLEAEFCQISADGAASFLHWIGERTETGPINIASEGVMSMGELIEHIEKATGCRGQIRKNGNPDDETPFADADSRVMLLDRARQLGYRFENLREWLLPLIQELAQRPRIA